MSAPDGGAAFPVDSCYPLKNGYIGAHFGMTLRDYFAAKAMQGLYLKLPAPDEIAVSQWAYKIADAMLAERAKEKK